MDKRLIGVFIFAGLVALVTSAVVYKLLAGRIQQAGSKPQEVYVASRDLRIGTMLAEADLKLAKWSAPVPKTAVITKEALIERAVVQEVAEGELFTEARIAPRGGGAGLAAKIPAGMRAIAVKVNEVVGVAGFVLPGMRVDVIALGEKPGRGASDDPYGTRSKTILQNVEVLSAGQNIDTDPKGKPSPVQVVNLLVTPEQAEMLSLVGTEAKLQLLLRNPLDTAEVKTPGTAQGIVFGDILSMLPSAGKRAAPVRKAAPPPPPKTHMVTVPVTMEIISGAKRADVKVGETQEEQPIETAAGRKR